MWNRFGFCPVARSQVPPAMQCSLEFTSLRPASVLAMALHLGGRKGRPADFSHEKPAQCVLVIVRRSPLGAYQ